MGAKLPSFYLAAGLLSPYLRFDAPIGYGLPQLSIVGTGAHCCAMIEDNDDQRAWHTGKEARRARDRDKTFHCEPETVPGARAARLVMAEPGRAARNGPAQCRASGARPQRTGPVLAAKGKRRFQQRGSAEPGLMAGQPARPTQAQHSAATLCSWPEMARRRKRCPVRIIPGRPSPRCRLPTAPWRQRWAPMGASMPSAALTRAVFFLRWRPTQRNR